MNKIKDADNLSLSKAYSSWDDQQTFNKASRDYAKALDASQPIMRSSAAIANRFQNIDGNTSVRDSASSLDYKWFRPGESVGIHFRDLLAQCMAGYQKVPVIKQTIDLMGDFTAKGIKIVCEDEIEQAFTDEWAKTVNMPERSERIANILYRVANVIIKRADAKLEPVAVQQWKKTVAYSNSETDLDPDEQVAPSANVVPYRYTILNPLIIEVLGEHVAAFTGKVHYVLKLPSTFYNSLSLPLTSFDPSILTMDMPRDLQQAMENNERYLLLDSDKLVCLFYHKDDWDVWAYPMLYSLLDEIILLQKMKYADMTALDGVISHIRVWKLGSMEHKIFPTNSAITKLSNILLNHLAGGAMDLVWGPDLELAQTSTDIAKFLGSEKYEFCMNTIHAGLGIPAAIGRSKGSMSDNFMSLRVLIERLEYGRRVLTQFWTSEYKRVRQAMGFKSKFAVMYENMVLHDEIAEKALWLQLLDRNVVPIEAVQERFGRIPEIDKILLLREQKARLSGKMVNKVSPYEDPEPDLSLTKIYAQGGLVTPSELPNKFNLHLKEASPEHQDIKDAMFAPPPEPAKLSGPSSSAPATKPKGVSGQGRPTNSKDTKKRKQRTPQPSAKAEKASNTDEFMHLVTRAKLFQVAISQVIDEYFLTKYDKKSIAELSPDEGVEMSKYKFHLLLNCKADMEPKPSKVADMTNDPLEVYERVISEDYPKLCKSFEEQLERSLTIEDTELVRCYIYALLKGKYNE